MRNVPGVYVGGATVTPHDSNANQFSALYVGGTGDVTVIGRNGDSVLFKAVPVGAILPIATSKVMSTGTTATLITGLRQ